VLVLFRERLALMLESDDARFANWDQDATAVERRYGESDPAVVSSELVAAGEALADAFEAVTGDQWHRTGLRSDGSVFTVATFAQYFWHDVAHHLVDVGA
jgi:predicted carbohydrate-binding protein with CBM5 and CBM33 domain